MWFLEISLTHLYKVTNLMKNSRSFHAKSISKIRLNSESSVEDIIGQLNNNACSISNIAHGLRIISEKLSSKSLSNQLDTQYRAIKDKIEDELDALDSHGIIDLCCWMKNQNIILSMNARMKLDRLLTDLILKGNLENKHIIEIYHYLKPLGYSITELESTVDRLVQEPEIDLSLNEI